MRTCNLNQPRSILLQISPYHEHSFAVGCGRQFLDPTNGLETLQSAAPFGKYNINFQSISDLYKKEKFG